MNYEKANRTKETKETEDGIVLAWVWERRLKRGREREKRVEREPVNRVEKGGATRKFKRSS